MGSIFKPSTTVVQAPQQQTVTQQIPEYFKEIQERTLRRAEDLGNRPYQAFTRCCKSWCNRCTNF
jgi:hypothetical protein